MFCCTKESGIPRRTVCPFSLSRLHIRRVCHSCEITDQPLEERQTADNACVTLTHHYMRRAPMNWFTTWCVSHCGNKISFCQWLSSPTICWLKKVSSCQILIIKRFEWESRVWEFDDERNSFFGVLGTMDDMWGIEVLVLELPVKLHDLHPTRGQTGDHG